MKEIFERRSIRRYTSEPVSEEQLTKLLKAAMAAPSAGNEQPWEFIVVRDRMLLNKIADVHPYASMLREAPLAVIICGDHKREKYNGFWVQDCSAATENLLIEAQSLGLGAVWLGVYPNENRVKDLKKLFNIPEHVTPLCVVAVGHPGERKEPADRYDSSRIHNDRW